MSRDQGFPTEKRAHTRASARDLSRLLTPAAIALVGASSNPQVSSGQPLRYLKEYGYAGKIYPVNPKRQEVQGIKSYGSVLAIPEACDVAVITVPAPLVPGIIRECGVANIPFAVVLTAGFENIGGAPSPLQQELEAAIADSGVRVVGPNCTGVVNLNCHSYCAQGGALSDPTLQPGPVAVVAQSGGVGLSMLAFIHGAGTGVGYLVSSGNEVDLDVFDIADYLLDDPGVAIIALYLETSTKGRKLRALGRKALALGKPVVVLKAGNTGVARSAAASHTGRLTSDYALFRAAFREGGYIEVSDVDELVETIQALNGKVRPQGNRIAIQTTSGGWGVMLAERCEHYSLTLPQLSQYTLDAIRPLVPSFASLANPLDMTPQGYADHYASYNEITRHLLADPDIDLLVVRSATGSDMEVWAERLIEIVAEFGKPVFVHWATSPHRYQEIKERLEGHGIPCFSFVNQIARNAAATVDFALKIKRPLADVATPLSTPASLGNSLPDSSSNLGESAAVRCLRAYGIPVAQGLFIRADEIDQRDLNDLRFPVAVKVESADIPHKTDVGGVTLGLNSDSEVREAAHRLLDRVRTRVPQAALNGVLVQEMATGLEMIVGAVNDPHFGPYVMLGMGGILAEVIRDVTYRFAPVSLAEALSMVDELKGRRLLEGNRGQPAGDVAALVDTIVRLSRLISDCRNEISEIEINPLFVRAQGQGVIAADCLISLCNGNFNFPEPGA